VTLIRRSVEFHVLNDFILFLQLLLQILDSIHVYCIKYIFATVEVFFLVTYFNLCDLFLAQFQLLLNILDPLFSKKSEIDGIRKIHSLLEDHFVRSEIDGRTFGTFVLGQPFCEHVDALQTE